MPSPVVSVSDLRFAWPGQSEILDIETLTLGAGERLFLRGPSGSGKSTLLGLIAGVLETQHGQIDVLDQTVSALSGSQRDRVRADHLGVIFQMFNLVPYLSVVQNVVLPCRFSKRRAQEAKQAGGAEAEALRLLKRLGLDDEALLNRNVTELSVGQQQRVAAARALIGNPSLIIADEPTSALDADSRDRFIELLSEDAKLSHAEIGQRVGLSTSSVHRRIRALEESGVIEGYGVRINEAALDRATSVFVQVTLSSQQDDGLKAFEQAARLSPDIAACYLMTGEADYLLRVFCADLRALNALVQQVLLPHPAVSRVQSQIVMDQLKRDAPLPT